MSESGINQTGTRPRALSATLVGVIVFSILSGVSAAAQAATVEGVTFSREVRAGDSTLMLRGYGLLRYMVFIKAYVAAFYLPERIRSEDALGDVPKHLEIEYFHDIPAQDFAHDIGSPFTIRHRSISFLPVSDSPLPPANGARIQR